MKISRLFNLLVDHYVRKRKLCIFNNFPQVASIETTTSFLLETDVSISRFGDGEFNLIAGIGNGFQEPNVELSNKLKTILLSGSDQKCAVCLPDVFYSNSNPDMKLMPNLVWSQLLLGFYPFIQPLIENKASKYYNSFLTRPYMDFQGKAQANEVFSSFRQLFSNKNILVVEGEGTKFGYGNNLLNSAKKIDRIITKNINAYDFYKEIHSEVLSVVTNYDIVLIALGPTATVLAYEISKITNIRIFDIGHLDIEYEWYINGSDKKSFIKNKSVNELGNNSESYKTGDKEYLSSILVNIGID